MADVSSWDGSSWSSIDWPGFDVILLASYNNMLIAGGIYYDCWIRGCSITGKMASWDGNNWREFGQMAAYSNGFPQVRAKVGEGEESLPPPIISLAAYDDKLIVGGLFYQHETGANCISLWNGGGWSRLGSGVGWTVNALAVFNNELYVGGDFTSAGNKISAGLAKWNKHTEYYAGPVWHVTVDGEDSWNSGSSEQPFRSIGRATMASQSGDTVIVGPGYYSGGASIVGKDVVLISESGASSTTIYGSITLRDTDTVNSVIKGFTFTNGANGPGGVTCRDANVVVDSNVIYGNCVLRNSRARLVANIFSPLGRQECSPIHQR